MVDWTGIAGGNKAVFARTQIADINMIAETYGRNALAGRGSAGRGCDFEAFAPESPELRR